MWSKGAVVVIKHGDTALADMIANGNVFQSKSVEELKNIERLYIIRESREKNYWDTKIARARWKYRRIGRRQEDNWRARVEVIWACVVNQVHELGKYVANRTIRIMKGC